MLSRTISKLINCVYSTLHRMALLLCCVISLSCCVISMLVISNLHGFFIFYFFVMISQLKKGLFNTLPKFSRHRKSLRVIFWEILLRKNLLHLNQKFSLDFHIIKQANQFSRFHGFSAENIWKIKISFEILTL